MAIDWAGGIGGGLAGAAAGSAIFPGVGTAIGGLLGLGSGLFGTPEAPEYEPTKVERAFQDYALDRVKASKATKAAARAKFKNLVRSGNRGAAEAYLESQKDIYSNPEFALKRLEKSYRKPIDYTDDGFAAIAKSVYGQQGLGFTGEEYGSFADRAKALGIRSPQAFGDMLKQDLIASRKVPTAQQEMLANIFGPAERDPATGKLTGRYGGASKPVTMPSIPAAINYNYA